MNLPWPWQCLDLDQSASVTAVRRRYAELLKLNRPEDNPDGFQQLRRAYEICLAFAREREAKVDVPGESDGTAAGTISPASTSDRTSEATASSSPHDAANAAPPAVVTDPDAESPIALPHLPPPNAHSLRQSVSVELPAMRAPNAVVDELLTVDRETPLENAAFAHYFAECPELASFVTRNDVELELLRQITLGARPTLRALQQFGAAFGWRQLGHERHLLQLGVPRDALPRIDDALFRAGAEAQFEWHLATQQRLTPERNGPESAERERAMLRRLRELRDTPPGFRALLSSSRIARVTRLFDGWSQNYGNAATVHLFGAANVAYWRRASPAAEPNLLQSLAGAARAAIAGTWVLAAFVTIGIAAALRSEKDSDIPLFQAVGILLAVGVPAIIVGNVRRLVAARIGELLRVADAQHEMWRQRHLARWLTPTWAIPGCIAVGALLGHEAHDAHWLRATIPAVALCLAAFGWRSLFALALYTGAIWGTVRVAFDGLPLLPSLAAGSLTILPVWFADQIARRRLPEEPTRVRWRVILGYSLPICILALVLFMAGVAVYQTTRS